MDFRIKHPQVKVRNETGDNCMQEEEIKPSLAEEIATEQWDAFLKGVKTKEYPQVLEDL